ncbi:tripartite tricarboxylate transporter substrate binding protein [Comamonas humi]
MTVLHRRSLLVLALAASAAVQAQPWPDKPIRLIVPYTAGSASDLMSRVISEPLAKALGQPIVIDNKPGANSTLGTHLAAKSAPDGYTLLMATNAGLAASPGGLTDNVPYDPLKDLRYITLVGSVSYVWIANNDMKARSAKEMLDYIKAHPKQTNYASGNTGGIAYGGFLKNTYGLDITHASYKSTPPAIVDLIGGQVQVMMADVASATPMIQSGKVKALGVPVAQRNPLLPDVPTFAEQGLVTPPDMSGWWMVAAPAGTPEAVLTRLNTELVKVLGLPEVRAKLLQSGIVASPSSREEAAKYQREQLDVWRRMVKELDLKGN